MAVQPRYIMCVTIITDDKTTCGNYRNEVNGWGSTFLIRGYVLMVDGDTVKEAYRTERKGKGNHPYVSTVNNKSPSVSICLG